MHFFWRSATIKNLQINRQIRDKEIRLVSDSGEQLGVMPTIQAFRLAEEQGLDLVKVSPNAVPPVCKILDYGKFRFETEKKEKEAKKNQKVVELKEVRLSMTIDDNDLLTKSKSAKKFLEKGDKVKVSIRMKGRQNIRSEFGIQVMNGFFETVQSVGTVERPPLTEGRNIFMILAPLKDGVQKQEKAQAKPQLQVQPTDQTKQTTIQSSNNKEE